MYDKSCFKATCHNADEVPVQKAELIDGATYVLKAIGRILVMVWLNEKYIGVYNTERFQEI